MESWARRTGRVRSDVGLLSRLGPSPDSCDEAPQLPGMVWTHLRSAPHVVQLTSWGASNVTAQVMPVQHRACRVGNGLYAGSTTWTTPIATLFGGVALFVDPPLLVGTTLFDLLTLGLSLMFLLLPCGARLGGLSSLPVAGGGGGSMSGR